MKREDKALKHRERLFADHRDELCELLVQSRQPVGILLDPEDQCARRVADLMCVDLRENGVDTFQMNYETAIGLFQQLNQEGIDGVSAEGIAGARLDNLAIVAVFAGDGVSVFGVGRIQALPKWIPDSSHKHSRHFPKAR